MADDTEDRRVSLGVPQQLLDSLPEDGANAASDLQRAVEGIESSLNEAFAQADSNAEAASHAVDAIERLEERMETYDSFVPELRAWGQSPIYAIAWRNLQADLIAQIREYDWLDEHIERERTYRLVEDGIRFDKR